MTQPTWEYVKQLSENLKRASNMKESELKHRLIKALTTQISETLERIQGSA